MLAYAFDIVYFVYFCTLRLSLEHLVAFGFQGWILHDTTYIALAMILQKWVCNNFHIDPCALSFWIQLGVNTVPSTNCGAHSAHKNKLTPTADQKWVGLRNVIHQIWGVWPCLAWGFAASIVIKSVVVPTRGCLKRTFASCVWEHTKT